MWTCWSVRTHVTLCFCSVVVVIVFANQWVMAQVPTCSWALKPNLLPGWVFGQISKSHRDFIGWQWLPRPSRPISPRLRRTRGLSWLILHRNLSSHTLVWCFSLIVNFQYFKKSIVAVFSQATRYQCVFIITFPVNYVVVCCWRWWAGCKNMFVGKVASFQREKKMAQRDSGRNQNSPSRFKSWIYLLTLVLKHICLSGCVYCEAGVQQPGRNQCVTSVWLCIDKGADVRNVHTANTHSQSADTVTQSIITLLPPDCEGYDRLHKGWERLLAWAEIKGNLKGFSLKWLQVKEPHKHLRLCELLQYGYYCSGCSSSSCLR